MEKINNIDDIDKEINLLQLQIEKLKNRKETLTIIDVHDYTQIKSTWKTFFQDFGWLLFMFILYYAFTNSNDSNVS